MTTPSPSSTLDALYPIPPKETTTAFSPTQHAGVSAEAGKTLVKLLKDNHEKHHIFFNDKGFHNHATHHLYAIYTLGATSELLEAAYATHVVYQFPAFDSPGEITVNNWKDHFGDDKYYRAYLKFFSTAALERGIASTLETYCFSQTANFEPKQEHKDQPRMVTRLLSGLLHPFIHVGHAFEFDSPGMLAEGLAMACVTHAEFDPIIPEELFVPQTVGAISRLTAALSLGVSAPQSDKKTHLFSILARMLNDPELGPGQACSAPGPQDRVDTITETMEKRADLIVKYASEWSVNTTDPVEVKAKMEELSWAVTLMFGVAGLQPDKSFNADFFSMHLVTSCLFVHSFMKSLSPPSQSILLRAYLTASLTTWVSRGRPNIDIDNFYQKTSNPSPPGPQPTPNASTLVPSNVTPNPWHALLQSTIMHPNEHLPKLERSLAHFAILYGTTSPGHFEGTELPGAKKLDGSVFMRVAGLSMNRLGWLREGQEIGEWDFKGFWN